MVMVWYKMIHNDRNMVVRAGQNMRNNVAKEGAKIIGEANSLLDGLCTQVTA